MDYIKASIVVSTSCSVILAGTAAYCAKQNAKLNQTIAEGVSLMREDLAIRLENRSKNATVKK